MRIEKIVVGTDFSETSEAAVKQAMNVARHVGAEVVLVHAGTVPEHATGVPGAVERTADHYETLIREHFDDSRRELELLRERYHGRGARVSHMVVDEFPDTGICDAARELGADLVVTGTHGRTGIRRFLLGSVAERVVRLSDRSVLVARAERAGAGGYRRILVPTDFTDIAEEALSLATALVADGGAIELHHSWEVPPLAASHSAGVGEEVLDPIRTSITTSVSSQGRALAERHTGDRYTVTFHASRNAPAEGIQQRIEEGDIDLVVMGSHGRRGIRRFLLGSVAEATVRHAHCSVLVVHGRGDRHEAPHPG